MSSKFILKMRDFWRKNKPKIIIALLIWLVIIVINYILKNFKQEELPKTTYEPHIAIMDNSEVPEKLQDPIENLIDKYINYCNNKEYENAYTMISSNCRNALYPDIESFKKYIDSIFNTTTFNITFNISKLIFYILIFLVLISTHEFIHLVCIPNFLKSEKTYWGITFYGGFVATTEKISKSRFVIISIMPFLFISIIFPLIMALLGFLSNSIIFFCFINAAASSVDILNLFIILFQVPNNSHIVNNGNETYYKLSSN